MRKIVKDFFRRGVSACGFGPLVLAVLYLILEHQGLVGMLSVREVCLGIFTLTGLVFVAGGMNVIYQVERLPLMMAVLIHGCVLYVSYLATYLLNGWLDLGTTPVLVFTGIFVLGYLAIWAVIYCIIRRKTDRLNEMLKKKQQSRDAS